MNYKKGDKVIDIQNGKSYIIKYTLGLTVVVASGDGYDMPLRHERIVLHSPLMEELI